MNIIDFIRLIRKHLVLLIIVPVLMAGIVVLITRNPVYRYASETMLYTGIASGTSIEMDKSFNFFANNTAFDNLINVVKSRETQLEVSLRMIALHLLLDKADPKYISNKSFLELQKMVPDELRDNIKKIAERNSTNNLNSKVTFLDSIPESTSLNETDITSRTIPYYINKQTFEEVLKLLFNMYQASDSSFAYAIFNYPDTHYSFKELSGVKAQRIASSDLVQLKFESDDPGICKHTLVLITEVCAKNYKEIRENRSDEVIKYFEAQLAQASNKLSIAEDKLLEFNKKNNIINYYEQSKAIAIVKEDLDVEFNEQNMKLSGVMAAIEKLENKLEVQQQIQLKNGAIVEKRNQLSQLNYLIIKEEALAKTDSVAVSKLAELNGHAQRIKEELKNEMADFYGYGNTPDGMPVNTVLNEWLKNVVEAENLKAGLIVLANRINEFQKQYEIYAPAGANIKRIEREISVSEEEFIEILHGLNLAKLKLQDNELAANIKTVDPPFFPLTPIPTKRKILVILAALIGFIMVLTIVFVLEYFDDTLKNHIKAEKIMGINSIGIIPKITRNQNSVNIGFITNRLIEIIIQKTQLFLAKNQKTGPRVLILGSMLSQEGKTTVLSNLAAHLRNKGYQILALTYNRETLTHNGNNDSNPGTLPVCEGLTLSKPKTRLPLLNLLLGYPDNRIDYSNPFLTRTEELLQEGVFFKYDINHAYYNSKNYKELTLQNQIEIKNEPDYVLIELPPMLYFSVPNELLSTSDVCMTICRSNRVWSQADDGIMKVIGELVKGKHFFILNGVDLTQLEMVLGDLPKKRSWLRKTIKRMVKLQVNSKNQI
ncbi:MAG: hypothetical protein JXR61_10160 [Prolixibacteraceae bacterium]|nr:hypothetical protein [Prolixibacteraceae bacterium]